MRRAHKEAQLQVPSAAHPQSSTPSQGKTARHPDTLPNTTHKLPHVGKYNRREPGKRKKMLDIISHPEMESRCNWDMHVGPGSCLDPTALEESQHNSSPPPTSPLDLLCSFGDCSTRMFSTENVNLQVTSVLSTAFIQCSYFVVWRKALHLFSCFMQEWPRENSNTSFTF